MSTIKDVAKEAKVSLSTASYALNGDPRVSAKTRLRILDVAKKLDYYPNSAARSLKSKRTNIIGAFITEYAGPVFSTLLNGIHKTLQQSGYDLVTTSSRVTAERFLRERSVDGAIVLDSYLNHNVILETANEKLPIFLLDRELEGDNIYISLIDNEILFYNLTNMLIKKNCSKIIYISGVEHSFDNMHRFQGYLRAMRENEKEEVYYKGDFTKMSGYQTMLRIIEDKIDFDAIACANDEMAIGAMDALNEKGYRIPEEVVVTGFDDIELSRYYRPSLTSVAIDREEWGSRVAQKLVKVLNGEPIENRVLVSGNIVERESTNR